MDPLVIIENRLEQLERKIGYDPDTPSEMTVIDQLAATETALNNITSGHEKIAEINRRLDDLDAYLDSQFANQVSENKLRSNYIFTNEPHIRYHCKTMEKCQEKIPVLDSEVLSGIPKQNIILNQLKEKIIENKDQSDQAEKCIQQMMETCHQVSLTIMEKLVTINKKIDSLEKSGTK